MAKQSKTAKTTTVETAAPAVSNKLYWLIGAILLLMAVVRFTYQNALDNQFVTWDDPMYVTENPMMLQYGKPNAPSVWNTPIALNYHPLTMKTLLWNAQNLGKKVETDARPFISMNIWLHALNAALVFLFFWLFTRGNWFVSLFGGLMFAVHPMHVESVAWVAERKDVLYAFFFLLALITYLRFLDTKKSYWYIFALFLFVLSCLSKAMAVSLVPILLLIDWYQSRSLRSSAVWMEKIPFIAIALFFGLLAINIQGGGNFHGMLSNIEGVKSAIAGDSSFSFANRLTFAAYGMVQYIVKFFVPMNFSAYYPYPEEVLNSLPVPSFYYSYIVVFILIGGFSVWSLRKTKALFLGFVFYVAAVLLVAQIISVGTVIMADRYTYVPYIGLSLGLLLLIDQYVANRKNWQYAAYGILGVVNMIWLTQTMQQANVWQNTETIFSQARQLYPGNESILNTLGLYYGKNGKLNEAKACFEEALNGKYPIHHATIYEGLGNIYGIQKEPQKAVEMFTKAIEKNPTMGTFYFNRAIAVANFDVTKALADLDKAMPLMPLKDRDKIYLQRAVCYLQLKDYQRVIDNNMGAIKDGFSSEYTYYQMGIAKFNMGNKAAAIQDLEQALKINPNFADAKATLAQIKTN